MKVEVKEQPAKAEPEFPCLMVSKDNGLIVLFTAPQVGLAIRHPNGLHYCSSWNMDPFTPFTGSVTLSND